MTAKPTDRHIVAIFLLIIGFAVPLPAQNQPIPKLPILESTTIMLGRIDLRQIDMDGISKWFSDGMAQTGLPDAERQEIMTVTQRRFGSLGRGIRLLIDAGATVVYFATPELRDDEPMIYFPLAPNTDVERLRVIVRNGGPTGSPGPAPETAQPGQVITGKIGDGLFLGRARDWKRLSIDHPGAPHLVFALNNAPAAPIQVVAAPSEDLTRFLEERMPQLPPPANMPMTTLTRGVASAVLTGQLPPKGSARLVIQASDAQAAAQLKTVAESYLTFLSSPMVQEVLQGIDVQAMIRQLTPQVKEDQLVLSVEDTQITPLFKPMAASMLADARRTLQHTLLSASHDNVQQITTAIIDYAKSHNGVWPDTLEQLGQPQLLVNPRGGPVQPDYIYRKPAMKQNEIKTPNQEILVTENLDDIPTEPPVVAVAFVDGTVVINSRKDTVNQLKKPPAGAPTGQR